MQETAPVTKEDLVEQELLCPLIVALIEEHYPTLCRRLEKGEEVPGFFPLPETDRREQDWLSPHYFREKHGMKTHRRGKAYTWLCREIFVHLAAVHLKARRREGQLKPTIRAVEQILLAHDFDVSINRKQEKEAVILKLSEMPVYEQILRYYPKPSSEAMWADIDKHRNDSC